MGIGDGERSGGVVWQPAIIRGPWGYRKRRTRIGRMGAENADKGICAENRNDSPFDNATLFRYNECVVLKVLGE